MKERILAYCTQLMPAGGIENHIIEFCKNMSPYFEIDLVVANFKMNEHESTFKKFCNKVFFIKSKYPWKRHISLLRILVFLSINKKWDILYTNGNGASVFFAGKVLRYKKWVLHHHMEANHEFFKTLNAKYRKGMLLASNVIACSRINAINLSKELNRHVDVVYCFSRDLGNNKHINKLSKGKLNFGYYGRLIAAKGIDLICRLSEDAECKHISFHLWGNGDDYSPSFFSKFHNLVYHGPFYTMEKLKQITDFLDAFLLLTMHPEGLPISLLEIMSTGMPWISTDKGGILDVVCDPISTKIINVKDYGLVKQSVLSLSNDIKNDKVSRDKQQLFYKENFSPCILVNEWISIFTS